MQSSFFHNLRISSVAWGVEKFVFWLIVSVKVQIFLFIAEIFGYYLLGINIFYLLFFLGGVLGLGFEGKFMCMNSFSEFIWLIVW